MYNLPRGMSYDNKEMASYKTLQEALTLAKQAVQGEREDELFYDYLISIAPTKEEKDIIASIRDDERKHNKMFREIYYTFTGREIPPARNEEFTKPASYIEGIKKALFGELAAMERYRIIRAGLPNKYYRDMVFEILTDELKHADKYNYILNINPKEVRSSIIMQMDISDADNSETDVTNMQQDNTDNNEMDNEMNNEMDNEVQMNPDELVTYITPLVDMAMEEVKEGINLEHLFQEYILSGVLVGAGYTPEQAIEEVEDWEKTGKSKLLQESKMKK